MRRVYAILILFLVCAIPGLRDAARSEARFETPDGISATPQKVHLAEPAACCRTYLPLIMKDYTPPQTPWVTVTEEGFEASTAEPWEFFDHGTAGGEYYWARRTCRPYSGDHSAWAVGGGADGTGLNCFAAAPEGVASWMVYGPFSLADATAAELRFRLWENGELGVNEGFCMVASTDNLTFGGQCPQGQPGGWTSLSLDLGNSQTGFDLLGQPRVWVALVYTTTTTSAASLSEGAYVDDIVIRKCVATNCPSTGNAALATGVARVKAPPMTLAPRQR